MAIIAILIGIIVFIGFGMLVMSLIFGSDKHDDSDESDERIGF
jgi:flagellar basal body-associated protein FliL